ncbi:MAG: asparagine synthase-related protein [Verrucomicrobiota bacterium]
MKPSPLGILPHYHHEGGSGHGPTIRSVLAHMPQRDWDEAGVRLYLNRSPDGHRTCFDKVRMVAHARIQPSKNLTAATALEQAIDELAQENRRAAIALSGGLDSALVLAMLRARGRDDIPVVTLVSSLPGYCEWPTTKEAANTLGVHDLRPIEVSADDFITAFPQAITAAECPLFNLHPVSRWLLANQLRAQGIEVLITGDGADQVFAGSDPRNYLPIVGALTRAAGLELRSPFLDERVMASAPSPSSDKAALRGIARTYLPSHSAQGAKRGTYTPPLDVSAHWRAEAITSLSNRLHTPAPQPGSSPESVLWTSLGILSDLLH